MIRNLAILSCCITLAACDSANTLTQINASTMCSRVFISNLDPKKVMDEELNPATDGIANMTQFNIDREQKTVTNRLLANSSKAIYREGLGCTLVGAVSEQKLREQYLPLVEPVALDPELPWPNGLGGISPLAGFDYNQFNSVVDYHFTEHEDYQIKTSSVLAAYQGKLIYERYAPGYSSDSNLQIYSVAKTITSVLTGLVANDNLLDIHTPVSIDNWTTTEPKSAITPHHLLTMTSGLDFNETYGDKESDVIKVMAEEDMVGFAASKPLINEPGSVWHYSSGDTLILSKVLKNSLGGDLSNLYEYMNRALFRKIGINSAIIQPDNAGNMSLSFQAFMTPRDVARFGQLLSQKGQWNGQQIISEQWLNYMTTPVALQNPYGIDYGASIYLNTSTHGTQQWPGLPEDTMTAIGYGGQIIVAVPSLDLVFVRTGLTEDFLSIMPEIHYLVSTLISSLPNQGN